MKNTLKNLLSIALISLMPFEAHAAVLPINTLPDGGTIQTTDPIPTMRSGVLTRVAVGSAAARDIAAFLQPSNNLSDLASASTARTNLGLGTAATQASTAFAQSISLATPALLYSTPVTFTNTSGAFSGSLSLVNQSANTFFAGPTTGAATTPTMRSLVAADLPVATTGAFGAVKPDGSTITISGGVISAPGGGSGTVTTASVVSANGLAGTVANATTTPAITLTTTVTGLVKGNGTALSAATAGTDYSAGTSALATGILKSTTGTGALTTAVAGDFPTLNQNTTGSAASFTGSLAGDVTGTQGATVVGKINGTSLAGLATGLLKNTTTTGVPSIATSSDVISLFSACSGTQYLGADGACHAAGGGSGTVTSVSVASANGISGTVANSTTTPAITLSLGAITPSSVAATGVITSATSALTISTGSIAVNAALGNYFYVTLAHSASTTMNAPTNPVDGQKVIFELAQDGTGSGTVSWNAVFNFGSTGAPNLTTTANKYDLVSFVYSSRKAAWLFTGAEYAF